MTNIIYYCPVSSCEYCKGLIDSDNRLSNTDFQSSEGNSDTSFCEYYKIGNKARGGAQSSSSAAATVRRKAASKIAAQNRTKNRRTNKSTSRRKFKKDCEFGVDEDGECNEEPRSKVVIRFL